eukprot:jgi/Chlat1/3441/Chrsp23S03762
MADMSQPLVTPSNPAPSWLRQSLPLGYVMGIPVRLHVLFFIPMALQLAVVTVTGFSLRSFLLTALLLGPILLITVLIHELGHCMATHSVGGTVYGILLWPLGGLAFIGHGGGPADDVKAAVWAILALIAGGGKILWHYSGPLPGHFFAVLFTEALKLQLFLMLFNLCLPAYPLDGGRIFADALLLFGLPVRTAAIVTGGTSLILSVGLVLWGFSGAGMLASAVGVWVGYQAFQLLQMVRAGTEESHPMFHYSDEQPENGI